MFSSSEPGSSQMLKNPSVNMSDSDDENQRLLKGGYGHQYEALSAKLKVTCPTCQGKGKLSQGQADSMVALIPVRDKRLKPRKTKLYLAITVIVALICIFLIAFFLLPRSVSIKIIDIQATSIHISEKKTSIPYIDVAITYQLKNENFFNAYVTDLSTDISWNKFILPTDMKAEPFAAHARRTFNKTFVSRQTFTTPLVAERVKNICATSWAWSLFEKFVTTAEIKYLSRKELVSDTYYGYTDCHNSTAGMKK